MFWTCSIASLILGCVALVVISKARGNLRGRGVAITSVVLVILDIGLIPMPIIEPPTPDLACLNNQITIFRALNMYYGDKGDHYPPSLSSLYPQYIPILRGFQCPLARQQRMKEKFDEHLCGYHYIYYPDHLAREHDASDRVLLFHKGHQDHARGMQVFYADGNWQIMPREQLVATLNKLVNNEKFSQTTRDSVRKTLAEVMAE